MTRDFEKIAARAAPAIFVVLWSTGFIGTKFGLPYAEPATFLVIRFLGVLAVLLPLCWLVLVRFALPFELRDQAAAGAAVERALAELGPLNCAERRVAAVFVLTAVAWVSRPLLAGTGRPSRLATVHS